MMSFSIEARAINSRNAGKMAVYIEQKKTYDTQFMEMYMYFMRSWKQDTELLSQWSGLDAKALKQALQDYAALNTPIDKPELPTLEEQPKIATLEPVPNTSDEEVEEPLASEASIQGWELDDDWMEMEEERTPQPGGAQGGAQGGVKRKRLEGASALRVQASLAHVQDNLILGTTGTKKVEEEAPTTKKAKEEAGDKKKEADHEPMASKQVARAPTTTKQAEEEAAPSKKVEEEEVAKKKLEEDAMAKKTVEEEAATKKKVEEEVAAKMEG